jgi:hypothetical protein
MFKYNDISHCNFVKIRAVVVHWAFARKERLARGGYCPIFVVYRRSQGVLIYLLPLLTEGEKII